MARAPGAAKLYAMPLILRVALPLPLPQLFDYLPVPGTEAPIGVRVRVPFGPGTRVGMVVAHGDASGHTASLKPIHAVLDDAPLYTHEMIASLQWAGDYWLGTPGDVWLGALPTWLRGQRDWPQLGVTSWKLTDAGRAALDAGTRRGRSKALLQALHQHPLSSGELDIRCPGWRGAARRLHKAGLVGQLEIEPEAAAPEAGPTLSAEQEAAVNAVVKDWNGFGSFVLDGVTGSGKTEVYLALIEKALAEGRQALILVPEIGLAPQTLRRLSSRLGVPIEVLHSNLAEGERARAWLRAREGRAKVIIGTRSAVFTPLPDAGLIVVDEEHDSSYKQQEGFRYHARDLALVRARQLDVPIVLGSATPSLESLANVAAGRHRLLRLTQRPQQRPSPRVHVLDSRGPHAPHGLGPTLLQHLDQCIERGEQALVFRNRRGYSSALICQACGWHAECEACDRPLTVHRAQGRLLCHHCGHWQHVPEQCPGCGEDSLNPRGYGTERIEDFLAQRYPDTPVLRVDSETTRRRKAFETLLAKLDAGGPVILVGTQMLAKGHDLPGLTLVAISGVDEGLYSVDFRAGEKLAQLIVQVAGRAGRADKPGSVVMQTHFPQHPLLTGLLRQGYHHLAEQMLDERRAAQLPPFSHQALLRVRATELDALNAFLQAAHGALPQDPAVRALGPLPAPMPRRAGQHRGQLLLESDDRSNLHKVLRSWRDALFALKHPRGLHWSLDVDPIDLY